MEKIQNQIDIQLANSDHLDQVVRIIHQTAKWLKSKSINQWSENYPISRLEQELIKGELFVVFDESQKVIGTLSLSKNKGDLWPEDNTPAIYLTRLAIFREHAGQQFGIKIINWVVEYCIHNKIKHLRLNCDKSNPFLSNFYKNTGFICIGEFYYPQWKMTFNLFEMKF